ncbi:hypothetical protein KEM60_01326 [Austwickia sp. TVS 96-490-7B]|nr:hypothetical protein [Austwickia sp. TVS 96-490-7B]
MHQKDSMFATLIVLIFPQEPTLKNADVSPLHAAGHLLLGAMTPAECIRLPHHVIASGDSPTRTRRRATFSSTEEQHAAA